MLKKFLAGMFVLLMISAQTSAMRLELDPQPIGKIFFDGKEFVIEGAKKLKGDSIKSNAFFGEDFYFHFDAAKNLSTFGDRCKKNSVSVDTFHGTTEIFRIGNTAGHDFYLLENFLNGKETIKVLGLRGGKWIEHLDSRALREEHGLDQNFEADGFFTADDNTLTLIYTRQNFVVNVICHLHAVNEKFYTEVVEQ